MGGKAWKTNTNILHCHDIDLPSGKRMEELRIEGEIQAILRGAAILCDRWRNHTRHEPLI